MGGQAFGEKRANLLIRNGRPDNKADQRGPGRTSKHHHRSRCHTRHAAQGTLDLADLDAISPDLHLTVSPAEKGELAVGQMPDEVPGSVHPVAGTGGVGDKPAGGHPGLCCVTAGDLLAGEIQLPRYPTRNGPQSGIQNVRRHAVHGLTNRGCG